MRTTGQLLVVVTMLTLSLAQAQIVRVSKTEEGRWLRWVIPLPRQIRIERKVQIAAQDVRIRVREGAGDVERTAAAELTALITEKSGVQPPTGPGKFEILLGVCDAQGTLDGAKVPGVLELAKKPNSAQAYLIQPAGANRLVLAALDERGVYYAAQTLRQLLEGQFADGLVTIPLMKVTDWPDLAERGEWGGSSTSDIEWLASQKMNLVEAHIDLSVNSEGRGVASVNPTLLERSRLHALKLVPIITHLDQIGGTGVYLKYPELKGKGPGAQDRTYPEVVAPCLSQPKTAEIIADWMTSLASQEGVTDVCIWLSENALQCGCEECRKMGQFVLEAKACVRAWELARQKNSSIRLRILLTQGSYSTNDKVLEVIPPEVGVSYYDGGKTYDSSRNPMIYPLLADYAAQGRWLGCYPQLTASWRIVSPWSGPQFIKARMNEFVDKKLQCLCGYATPHNRLYDFNVTAAAEWSWNSKGRTEREFSAAWATRRGFKDPNAVADWAITLGEVGWDVYGSGIPFPSFFGSAGRIVAAQTRPALGQGMFRYFPTKKHIEEDIAACGKAQAIADRLGDSRLLTETRVISGYVQMVREIYELCTRLTSVDMTDDKERRKVQDSMCRLSRAGTQTADSLEAWEQAVGPGLGTTRFQDTVGVTEQTVNSIATALSPYGIQDPAKPYRRHAIGKWETNDFEKTESVRKTWNVTEFLSGNGQYGVEFVYTQGWHGLGIQRVALATAPKQHPDQLTEMTKDEHYGVAAYQNKENIYKLDLPSYDPSLLYFVVADIRGTRSSDKPENHRGCSGEADIVKSLSGPISFEVPVLLPMTEDGMARFRGPRFSGSGLRVGVVMNGYGSSSALEALRKASSIDAQPVYRIEKSVLDLCQVVIVPQPRTVEVFGDAQAKLLREFVQSGGGVVVTHNAVGYRGLPPIVPDVCAKGLQHVRDENWIVIVEHPVTRGITVNESLTHSYYDHIELQPGAKGTIIAKAKASGRPVVVCGESGKGRYVACGMAIGLDVNDEDAAPTVGEKTLLENAVKWAGRQ